MTTNYPVQSTKYPNSYFFFFFKVPDQITVGGCKIFICVLNNEEICQPYILQSATSDPPQPSYLLPSGEAFNSQTTAHFANSSIIPSTSSDRGSGVLGNFRAKPGKANSR